ncbi:magnesium transporter CorA family protein [Sulfurimonas sp.]|uniref:magnesium transporter CorA family protein n=1 Tax=Sulfurimonas sp. TaxID=2022749 RepID=UPI003566FA61
MSDILKSVNSLHLEDLGNEIHPSIFDTNEEYQMLIVRLPIINKELTFTSIGFIITDDSSFFYDKSKHEFQKLDSRFEAPHKILNTLVDKLLKSFENYRDSISNIEETLYENKSTDSFMNEWLGLKRDILRIERILIHTTATISDVIESYKEADNFPINNYADLHEHLDRTLRSATLQFSKLDYLYNFYSARTNEKMNHLIYTLTIISAIFLPLNLLVGFFGMNTSGLPFTSGATGTFSVIGLILIISVTTTLIINFIRKKN